MATMLLNLKLVMAEERAADACPGRQVTERLDESTTATPERPKESTNDDLFLFCPQTHGNNQQRYMKLINYGFLTGQNQTITS